RLPDSGLPDPPAAAPEPMSSFVMTFFDAGLAALSFCAWRAMSPSDGVESCACAGMQNRRASEDAAARASLRDMFSSIDCQNQTARGHNWRRFYARPQKR